MLLSCSLTILQIVRSCQLCVNANKCTKLRCSWKPHFLRLLVDPVVEASAAVVVSTEFPPAFIRFGSDFSTPFTASALRFILRFEGSPLASGLAGATTGFAGFLTSIRPFFDGGLWRASSDCSFSLSIASSSCMRVAFLFRFGCARGSAVAFPVVAPSSIIGCVLRCVDLAK